MNVLMAHATLSDFLVGQIYGATLERLRIAHRGMEPNRLLRSEARFAVVLEGRQRNTTSSLERQLGTGGQNHPPNKPDV